MVPLAPIFASISKWIGKEAITEFALKIFSSKKDAAISKFENKIGKEATAAGISHLTKNKEVLKAAGMALGDKESRKGAIATISKIGLGSLGAAAANKFSFGEAPLNDVLAKEKKGAQEVTGMSMEQEPVKEENSIKYHR